MFSPVLADPIPPRKSRRSLAPEWLLLAIGLVCWSMAAWSGEQQPGMDTLREFVQRAAGHTGRVEVKVGQLDPRLQLAPCSRVEPFIPAGARLWGRSSIGIRCVEGASWSVMLPVTVSVFSKALIANQTLTTGAVPSLADFRVEEIDLTREAPGAVTDAQQLVGKVMQRPIAANQPLRADHLKTPPSVAAGDPVKVRVVGDGFSIAADAVALATGFDGQVLRIRMDNGKILAGTLRDRTVEIRL